MSDYADLVKWLRDERYQHSVMTGSCMLSAADAIETLVRERDEAIRLKDNWCNVAQDFCRERDEARAEREAAVKRYFLPCSSCQAVEFRTRAEAAEAEVARLRETIYEALNNEEDRIDYDCQCKDCVLTLKSVGDVLRKALEAK